LISPETGTGLSTVLTLWYLMFVIILL
jgi:hypothetical protein